MLIFALTTASFLVGFMGAHARLHKTPKPYDRSIKVLSTGIFLVVFASYFYALGGNKHDLALPSELSQFMLAMMLVGWGVRSLLQHIIIDQKTQRFLPPGMEDKHHTNTE